MARNPGASERADVYTRITAEIVAAIGAEVYAAAASVIATGRLYGLTALQAIANALAGKPVMIPP